MLAWAKPERFVTLTNAPESWQGLRQKVRKLALNLRGEGYRCEWAWTVERGSANGMKHVHLLQHGSYVPQKRLQDLWGAIVHIEAIRGATGASRYALKEARRVTAYALKESRASFEAHLELNGGRAYHLSRSYLRGKRTREVEKLLASSGADLHWFLVQAHEPVDLVRARAASIASSFL